MIRPAERFSVNIVRPEFAPEPRLARARVHWQTAPLAIAVAALVGAAIGGIVPTGGPPGLGPAVVAATAVDPAAIEPAAGPAAAATVARAPDGAFYAAVGIDRVPIVMRLDPSREHSLLRSDDAVRLGDGSRADSRVRAAELELADRRTGPVEFAVGGAAEPASVLGADLLDRLAVVTVEGDRLRLGPR
jgi:predicted aspartyl protease